MTEQWEDEGGSFFDDEEPEDEWVDGEDWIEAELENGWNDIDDIDDYKYMEES